MAYFNVKHDSGVEWKICVPSIKKTKEYIDTKAVLFVRNYCLKNFLKDGGADITSVETGEVLRFHGMNA